MYYHPQENDESGVAAAAASAGASTTKKEATDALAQALQSDSWTIGGVEKSSGETCFEDEDESVVG